jgi:exodeoxyribonuclease VIII
MKPQDYFAVKAISASFLKACSFSAHAGWKFLNEKSFQSDAMAFGSAVHTSILEPHLFNDQYAISEKFDKRTKVGKEASAAFELANAGKLIIDQDEFFKISKIKENCLAIPAVKNALDTFEKEKSLMWDIGDKKFKARLDLVDVKNGVVIDLKTTRDASERGFLRQLLELRYDIQLYHYLMSVKGSAAYAIAVETETCEVALYDLTDIVMSEFTNKRYLKALETAMHVMQMTECPPKFKAEIISLTLPKWTIEMETV